MHGVCVCVSINGMCAQERVGKSSFSDFHIIPGSALNRSWLGTRAGAGDEMRLAIRRGTVY